MAAKQTEDEFISVYEDGVAKRVAREAYRAIYPGGMHTNGPTMVQIEVSRLLLILARWRRPALETGPVCSGCHAPNTRGALLESGKCTVCEVL